MHAQEDDSGILKGDFEVHGLILEALGDN